MVRFALQTELKEIFQQLKQTIVMVTHEHGGGGVLWRYHRADEARENCAAGHPG